MLLTGWFSAGQREWLLTMEWGADFHHSIPGHVGVKASRNRFPPAIAFLGREYSINSSYDK
jgi:hypothetical protein